MVSHLGELREPRNFRASCDHDVDGCLRADVSECDNVLVFINDVAGNLSVDDFREESRHGQLFHSYSDEGISYSQRVGQDQDAIWAEMPGGGLLHDLFGSWPSFHNSELKSIRFDPAEDKLILLVDYIDDDPERDVGLAALIELVFSGIQLFEMELRNFDIMNLCFKKPHEFIDTEINFSDGSLGKVVSESVDASLSQLDPSPDGCHEGIVRLTYQRRA